MWGQIATMGYAVFGLPIFMLWLSNVGTLLAQTFTFLYANVCCFICRRGKRKKGSWALKDDVRTVSHFFLAERRRKKRAEEREREARGGSEGVRLLWSEREVSPALTSSTRVEAGKGDSYSAQGTLKMDPRLKEMLSTCATYNIDQADDDDPLSEAVVEELRHADKMDIINERSLAASPLSSPSKTQNRSLGSRTQNVASPQYCLRSVPILSVIPIGRSDREGSNYENGQELGKVDIKTKVSAPAAVSAARRLGEAGAGAGLLTPPPQHAAAARLSPVLAPKASMEQVNHSPSSSKLYLAGSERGDEDSFATKSIIKSSPPESDRPPPVERVPPLPVVVFLGFYLVVGKVNFD